MQSRELGIAERLFGGVSLSLTPYSHLDDHRRLECLHVLLIVHVNHLDDNLLRFLDR